MEWLFSTGKTVSKSPYPRIKVGFVEYILDAESLVPVYGPNNKDMVTVFIDFNPIEIKYPEDCVTYRRWDNDLGERWITSIEDNRISREEAIELIKKWRLENKLKDSFND